MIVGDIILTIVNFLLIPPWHLAIVYVVLLLLVILSILKSWGFKA